MAASIPPSDQTGIGGPTPWPANPGNVLKTAEDNIDKPVVNDSKNTNPVINEGNGTSQINGTKQSGTGSTTQMAESTTTLRSQGADTTGKMDTKETFDDRIGQTPDKMTPNGSKSVSYPIGGMGPLHDNDTNRQPRPASAKSMADVLKSDIMVCPICDKEMSAPKTLPCLHSFCEACISNNVANLKDEDPHCQIRCPVCEIPVSNSRNYVDAKVFAERLPSSLFISSLLIQKQVKLKQCKPCSNTGKITTADSWCSYCAETLCTEHLAYHNALTSPSTHHIFKLGQIEKNPQIAETSGKCNYHEYERIKYFCQDHKATCCEICWKTTHEMCDVESIELAASSVKHKPETTRLVGDLETMGTHSEHILQDRKRNIDDLEKQKSNEKKSIQKMREQINEHLDKLENNMMDDLDKIHRQKSKEIEKEISLFEHKQQSVSFYKLLLESVLKNSSDVLALTELAKIRYQVKILEENLYHRISKLKRVDFELVSNNLTESMGRFAEVEIKQRPITPPPSFESRPKQSGILTPRNKLIHSRRDKGNNFLVLRYSSSKITGGCSMKTSLILVDNRGKEIRGYSREGHREEKQVFSFKTESEGNPYDVTVLPPRRSTEILITTIPLKNRLQILEFGDAQNVRGSNYKTNGKCYGISYMDGYIIVACLTKLEIWRMDEDYNLMFERNLLTKGDHVFYVCAADNRICYTDSADKGSVVCTTLDGTDIFAYSHHSLRMPMGIVVDHTGSLYVAGYYSNNIHVISPEGVLMKITSPKEAHFNKPIFLMENEGKIFVTYDKHKITSLH